ncbi:MAG TPA: hypothetical protein VLM89_07180 [Phycisphaerae bacterium]|nr:hypothetical protein [Phycisphaerae bacterium]
MSETNRLSDGLFPTWRTCPYCDGDDTHVVWGLTNAGYLLATFGLLLFALAAAIFPGHPTEGTPLNFNRRCRHCGGRFRPQPTPVDLIMRGQYDYNLTGNITGRCPECGWELPDDVKQRVNLAVTKCDSSTSEYRHPRPTD